jgi:hypothetical protein
VRIPFKAGVVAVGLLGFASTFLDPLAATKSQRSQTPLFTGMEVPETVARVIERSCQNCHSERTEWPWYSYLPPMSWLIEKDVHDARNHMNFSRWQEYSTDQQREILSRMGAEVRTHRMPLPRYLQLHKEARLSEADIQLLYDWSHHERRRLVTSHKDPGTAQAQ